MTSSSHTWKMLITMSSSSVQGKESSYFCCSAHFCNILTLRLHHLSEFKPMIFLFRSQSCLLLSFTSKMILLSPQCLQIRPAFIGEYCYFSYSSYAKMWGCSVGHHMQLTAHSKLLSAWQGLSLTSVRWHELCKCSPTLHWFLCCHASAIKKNCWMRVIERNNGLLQDVQDRVITVYFLVQSCYEQASYLPACFICQYPVN